MSNQFISKEKLVCLFPRKKEIKDLTKNDFVSEQETMN